MEEFKTFMEEINIKNSVFNTDEKLATFHLSELDYSDGYKKKNIKKLDISFKNINEFFNSIILDNNFENAFFNLNTEVDYDNKIKGGRIFFKVYNRKNVYDDKNVNPFILNKILDEKDKKKITFVERNYFQLCLLIMMKNYFIKKNNNNFENKILKYISSFEGVILQKDVENIKIVLYLNDDYSDTEIKEIMDLVKDLIHVQKKLTLRFSPYKHFELNKTNINSKKDIFY